MSDPWGYGSKVVPGHPLYGPVFGGEVIADTLSALLPSIPGDRVSRAILSALARHDPPILLCIPSDMKDGDESGVVAPHVAAMVDLPEVEYEGLPLADLVERMVAEVQIQVEAPVYSEALAELRRRAMKQAKRMARARARADQWWDYLHEEGEEA